MLDGVLNNVGKPDATDFPSRGSAPEQELVAAAKRGDEGAFETLFNRHQQKVLRVVLRYTRVREDAEDIVQQSFQKVFVNLWSFEGKSSFSTWVTRIAINEALMFLRSGGRTREVSIDEPSDREETSSSFEVLDPSPDPETSCLRQEGVDILSMAIGNLRPGMQRAIELREIAELTTEETARHMGLSVGAVKARLFHARRKLREKLCCSMASYRTLKRNSSGSGAGRGTFRKIWRPQAHAASGCEKERSWRFSS